MVIQKKGNEFATGIKKLLKEPFLLISIISIFYFLLIFVIFPLYSVFKTSLLVEGKFSFANYLIIVSKSYYREPFFNSMILGVCTATIGTIIGFIFAYAITRTSLPLKKFFRITATFPMVSPPFIVALSAMLLFGRKGFLNPLVTSIIGEYSIFGLGGLVLVETIAYAPTAFLALVGVLQAIDPALEEASMDLGGSQFKVFTSITLPLAMPGILGAWLLVFIQSIADFGNPMVLSGDFPVLSVQAYLQITGALNDLARGSTLAIMLLMPTVIAFFVQKYLISKKSYVTVTGKPTGATVKNVDWYLKVPVYSVVILFTGTVFLFYGTIITGSFQRLWGIDSTFTFKNYIDMFAVGKDYIFDSLTLSSIATPITGFLGMFLAFLIIRKTFPGKNIMEFVSMLTFAVPGTVVGIGYVLAFNHKTFLFPFILTGTGSIIVLLLVFRNMPVGIRSGIASLQQISPSIEEASTDLGANSNTTFLKVTLPLITPAFFSGLVYSFVKAMTAISAIVFVVSGKWNLITVAILGFVDNADYAQAAAMSILLIFIVILALSIIQFLVNKIGKGAGASNLYQQ